jgi:hypothetical protein
MVETALPVMQTQSQNVWSWNAALSISFSFQFFWHELESRVNPKGETGVQLTYLESDSRLQNNVKSAYFKIIMVSEVIQLWDVLTLVVAPKN